MLLPRLRMLFAEFLNVDSSVRLRILSSPTCVGLWYGPSTPCLRSCFPALRLRALRSPVGSLALAARLRPRICLRASSGRRLDRIPFTGRASPYASLHRNVERCGNVDPLPVGYGLRPRLRGRLTLGQIAFTLETSGFRRAGISPAFPLLMPAFSLPRRPGRLPPPLRPARNAPLPAASRQRRGFGCALSPAGLSARDY